MFPTLRDIFFTSEPEACALYTVQDMLMKDRNSLIPVSISIVLIESSNNLNSFRENVSFYAMPAAEQ